MNKTNFREVLNLSLSLILVLDFFLLLIFGIRHYLEDSQIPWHYVLVSSLFAFIFSISIIPIKQKGLKTLMYVILNFLGIGALVFSILGNDIPLLGSSLKLYSIEFLFGLYCAFGLDTFFSKRSISEPSDEK